MRIALVGIDSRQNERAYHETTPRFGTGVDSMIEAVAAMPELELHVLSCTQRPMQSPEKLAGNIWFHSLHVPKLGWLRTGYQGCVRAMRRKFREIQPDIVHGVGTEREGAISAVFSGFPNVVAIAGNMAELARLNRPRFGTYFWLTARLENFLLPAHRRRDLQLALLAKTDSAPRQKNLADLSGSARPFSSAADPCRAAGVRAGDCRRHQSAQTPARTVARGGGAPSPGIEI